MAAHLCCTHPPRSLTSPEPLPNARLPSRRASMPLLSSLRRRTSTAPLFLPASTTTTSNPDDLETHQLQLDGHSSHTDIGEGLLLDTSELQRIFVAASLPADHPHALRLPGRERFLEVRGAEEGSQGALGLKGRVKRAVSRRSLRSVLTAGSGKGKKGGNGKVVWESCGEGPVRRSLEAVGLQTGTSLLDGSRAVSEGGFDGDARVLGSEEVIGTIEESGKIGGEEEGSGEADAGKEVRTSILKSLDWLRPALGQKSSFLRYKPDEANVAEIAGLVALHRQSDEDSTDDETPLPLFPQAVSSPNLLTIAPARRNSIRRSASAFNWEELTKSSKPTVPVVERTRLDFLPRYAWSAHLRGSSADLQSFLDGAVDPNLLDAVAQRENPSSETKDSLDVSNDKPDGTHNDLVVVPADNGHVAISGDDNQTKTVEPASKPSHSDLHLADMHISQQLRSMSAMSETLSEDSLGAAHQPWNLPRYERSIDENIHTASQPGRRTHSRNLSAASALLPSIWERVRGGDLDGTSSVYSRPASEAGELEGSRADSEVNTMPYDLPTDNSVVRLQHWPLADQGSEDTVKPSDHSAREDTTQAMPKTHPVPAATASDVPSEATQLLRVQPPPSPRGSKRSTSTLGKQSRFFERFTPPKKLVRKRRSIFKFLRPGSRKQNHGQPRSISTPTLWGLVTNPSSTYDGPADDPSLLTVHYELNETPSKPGRAASESNLNVPPPQANRLSVGSVHNGPDAASSHAVSMHETIQTASSTVNKGYLIAHEPDDMDRRKSLAEYECSLSVVGDHRRKPSTPNLHTLQDMHKEEKRKQSFSQGIARRFSRAKPLADNAAPLMEQALQNHVQEKSLFRSASKAREIAEAADRESPVFQTSSFSGAGSSRRPSAVGDQSDLLDPMERGELQVPDRRSYSVGQLGVADSPMSAKTSKTVPALRLQVPGTFDGRRSTLATSMPSRTTGQKRIGTSLASWSRYPSHSREQRCGSARDHDKVISRDFAVDIDPHTVAATDDEGSDHEHHNKPFNSGLASSRSMIFSTAFKHYTSMLFAPEFLGRARRTSISTGGKLDYPELEMVSPTLPHQHHHRHRASNELLRNVEQKLGDIEEHVKETVKEDKEKIRQHLNHDNTARASSPFRQGSPFAEGAESQPSTPKRESTMLLGPGDDDPGEPAGPDLDDFDDEPPHSFLHHHHHDRAAEDEKRNVSFDGTNDSASPETPRRPSRADLLADLYKAECLQRSDTPGECMHRSDTPANQDNHLMPPPSSSLKPVKPRSPEQKQSVELKDSIRRYPSVTVIDDRKGHWRSVSFISVRSSRSDSGFVRSSTNDLLELVRKREEEERLKLLGKSGNGMAT